MAVRHSLIVKRHLTIKAFKELGTAEKPVHRGSYAAFDNLLFAPKTKQLPHAPIWVGGAVAGACQPAGRLGDLPVQFQNRSPQQIAAFDTGFLGPPIDCVALA